MHKLSVVDVVAIFVLSIVDVGAICDLSVVEVAICNHLLWR